MGWSGSITNRGEAGKHASSSSLSSNTFTPAADSLVMACIESTNAPSASDLSGHDGGSAWAQVASYTSSAGNLYIFAAHPGSSPSSGAITLDSGYMWNQSVGFFEVTDVYTSGTVAQSFGTPANDYQYNGNIQIITGSHSNTEGLTFVLARVSSASDTIVLETGYTKDYIDQGTGLNFNIGYKGGEDTTIDVQPGSSWLHLGGIGIEIVGIAGPVGLEMEIAMHHYTKNIGN